MTLSTEALAGIRAHNTHKPEPCYNEQWNAANKTGTMRSRTLVTAALSFKYGMCARPMKLRKATEVILTDYLIYRNSPTLAWAAEPETPLTITTWHGESKTLFYVMRGEDCIATCPTREQAEAFL